MYKIVLVYFCLENCIRINYVFVCVVKVKFLGFFFWFVNVGLYFIKNILFYLY